MNRIEVRLANLDEASDVSQILREAFAEFEPLYTPEAFAVTTPNARLIEDRFDEGPIWIAVRDRHVVGTVAAIPESGELSIRSMAIRPSARGVGLGRLPLNHVERFAIANGFARLRLSTTPFLVSAIRLYERFGFIRTTDGPFELFGTPLFTPTKNF